MDKQELETEAKGILHKSYVYIKSKLIKHKKKSILMGVLSFAFFTFYPSFYKYLDDLRFSIFDVALAGNLITDHCSSFEGASEQEKINNNFFKNLDRYTQNYIDKLLSLTSKSDDRDLQGDSLNRAVVCYIQDNWNLALYLNRHNKCPSPIPTDDDFQKLEDQISDAFPISAIEYIILYGKLVVKWKIGYGLFGYKPKKEDLDCKMQKLLPDKQAGT